MAGGMFPKTEVDKRFEHRVTVYLISSCFMAAIAGFLFGYDLAVTGTHFCLITFISLNNSVIYVFPCIRLSLSGDSNLWRSGFSQCPLVSREAQWECIVSQLLFTISMEFISIVNVIHCRRWRDCHGRFSEEVLSFRVPEAEGSEGK